MKEFIIRNLMQNHARSSSNNDNYDDNNNGGNNNKAFTGLKGTFTPIYTYIVIALSSPPLDLIAQFSLLTIFIIFTFVFRFGVTRVRCYRRC